jgi:hypothetical protein
MSSAWLAAALLAEAEAAAEVPEPEPEPEAEAEELVVPEGLDWAGYADPTGLISKDSEEA